MIFLDFDRTLFDTDAFNLLILAQPLLAPHAERVHAFPPGSPERQAVWRELVVLMQQGQVTFSADQVASFLYPDVKAFFKRHQSDIVVVTFGARIMQEFKINAALPSCRDIVYVEAGTKGEAIARWLQGVVPEGVFVDDRLVELDATHTVCPNLRIFEMRRDGKPGSGTYPVVHSLSELERVMLK